MAKASRKLYYEASSSLLGSLLFGLNIAILNTCLNDVARDVKCKGFCHDEQEAAAWISSYGALLNTVLLATAAASSFVGGLVADALGPKKAQLMNCWMFIIGAALAAAAPGRYWLIALGRAVSGVGVGFASLLTPRYLNEIAPAEIRGALGTQTQIIINVGILLGVALGVPFELHVQFVKLGAFMVAWWRVMLAVPVAFGVLQFFMLLGCEESPVWVAARYGKPGVLGQQGEEDDASKALLEQAGGHSGGEVEELLEEAGRIHHVQSRPALLAPHYRLPVLLALLLPICQQLSGINTVVLYSKEIFLQVGLPAPIYGSILICVINILVTMLSALLVDRHGRKPLLAASHGGMAIALALMAAALGLEGILQPVARHQGALSLACISAYVAFFAIGSGPIVWLYIPEVLPPAILGPMQGIATCCNWLVVIAISQLFLLLVQLIQVWGAYLLFAACNVGALVFVVALVVETKQRSFEDIQRQLMGIAE